MMKIWIPDTKKEFGIQIHFVSLKQVIFQRIFNYQILTDVSYPNSNSLNQVGQHVENSKLKRKILKF